MGLRQSHGRIGRKSRNLSLVSTSANIRNYAIITLTYWAFTLSDGALRMMLLFHLHQLGHSAFTLASVFLLYEFFGIVTNLFSGWLSAKTGLKLTLGIGLILQIVACAVLAGAESTLSVPFVIVLQGLSGVAKDFTKMSSKSYIKMVVPGGDQTQLLRWVALLTGSKNTLKGVGYFLGGLLLTTFGFHQACLYMTLCLFITFIASMLSLPSGEGKRKATVTLRALLPSDVRLLYLSAARLFLFGSRDTWFVVGLPIFLSSVLGWSFETIGAALATWIIGYGIIQASAPKFLGFQAVQTSSSNPKSTAKLLGFWKLLLLIPLMCICLALLGDLPLELTLISGLSVFGFLFAANSALHSFLVLDYAEHDNVTLSVGFYYMSNAAGRLVGTLLSGFLFQSFNGGMTGLSACLLGALVLAGISALFCVPLARAESKRARLETTT